MKAYVVGGAVRDELLGLPVRDKDYVVVGSTPEEMARLGFKPVGKDFPVFLHPVSHEEYALARTERKSGRGYKGFTVYAAPDVTLEDDLRRRDLTINAIARAEDGSLVDPFGGAKDLKAGVLRHVSEAFAEDPVRILRVARFAARFGFKVAPGTMKLMKKMVGSGETDHLVAERVWQEFSKGLMEEEPERMFEVLRECGLYPGLFLGLKVGHKGFSGPLPVRFALLTWPLDAADVRRLCAALRAPNEVLELAVTASRSRDELKRARSASPARLLELLTRADALRRPERFADLLRVARIKEPKIDTSRVERAQKASAGVDAGAIAAKGKSSGEIARLVKQARIKAIREVLEA